MDDNTNIPAGQPVADPTGMPTEAPASVPAEPVVAPEMPGQAPTEAPVVGGETPATPEAPTGDDAGQGDTAPTA